MDRVVGIGLQDLGRWGRWGRGVEVADNIRPYSGHVLIKLIRSLHVG